MRPLLLVLVIVPLACGGSPQVTHTEYQYALATQPDEVAAGTSLLLTWTPTPRTVLGTASAPAVARVCVALVGPYADVAAAKASPVSPRTCPISVPGTMAATAATEVDLLIGAPTEQSLVVPSTTAPGFYDLWSVLAYGRTDSGNSSSGAGIIHVVARR